MRSLPRLTLIVLSAFPIGASAQSAGDFEVGARAGIAVADGEPANDVTSTGAFFRQYRDAGWAWGLGVDLGEFDFEEPARLLGIEQAGDIEAIDSKADVTDVSVFIERHRALGERWSWFWRAGAGVGSVDAPQVVGPTAAGGTFRIDIDASTEPFLLGALGVRRHFGNWSLEAAAAGQYRFADYELVDSVSGRRGSISGYAPIGLYVGLTYRF